MRACPNSSRVRMFVCACLSIRAQFAYVEEALYLAWNLFFAAGVETEWITSFA